MQKDLSAILLHPLGDALARSSEEPAQDLDVENLRCDFAGGGNDLLLIRGNVHVEKAHGAEHAIQFLRDAAHPALGNIQLCGELLVVGYDREPCAQVLRLLDGELEIDRSVGRAIREGGAEGRLFPGDVESESRGDLQVLLKCPRHSIVCLGGLREMRIEHGLIRRAHVLRRELEPLTNACQCQVDELRQGLQPRDGFIAVVGDVISFVCQIRHLDGEGLGFIEQIDSVAVRSGLEDGSEHALAALKALLEAVELRPLALH